MLSHETLFQEAKKLFMSGHPEESIKMFSKAQEEGCNPVQILLSRGAAYIKIGEYDKAIEDLGAVLDIDTDNERAFYFRGIANILKEEYAAAAADLTRSIALNHERGAAFLARSICYVELDRMEEAARDVKTAIAFSNIEVERFTALFGENRTLFDRSMALLEGERGPWSIVLDEVEINKLKKWIEKI